jgi:predicted Zn-ribbon and HTH transcriptional regulator
LNELNNLLVQKDNQLQELSEGLSEKDKLIQAQTAHIEEVEGEIQELKPPEIGAGGFASEERITCPMCGAVGGNIKTVEDKSKVLSYVGHIPMYAKKHVCKKCGYEF